jgi:hypothetical protein
VRYFPSGPASRPGFASKPRRFAPHDSRQSLLVRSLTSGPQLDKHLGDKASDAQSSSPASGTQ